MTQEQLDQAVALATGEDIHQVRRLGFTIADPLEVAFDPEPSDAVPQPIDWDELDLARNVAMFA